MTTETTKPRTLEEIVYEAQHRLPNGGYEAQLLIREAFAAGAASRASPEATTDQRPTGQEEAMSNGGGKAAPTSSLRASPEALCAGCGGCGDGRSWADVERVLNDLNVSQDPAVRGVVQMIRARLPRPGCPGGHRSDCATHNEPAFPNAPCDCGRASPEEGRAAEVDEAIDNFESAVRDNERGTDPHVPPMVVSVLRNALRMIALGSRPAVDHTGRQPTNDRPHYLTKPWAPPPEDSGAREATCWHACDWCCEHNKPMSECAPASSKEGGRHE